jgi:hypothetical protein
MATVLLVLWRWQELKRREGVVAFCAHVLTQASIWFVIILYLHRLFAGNVGRHRRREFLLQLGYNLRVITKLQQWPILLSVFDFSLPVVTCRGGG